MHYEIRLVNGAAIDPIVYWTKDVNPNAGLDPQTSRINSTGLLVSSIAAADLNGDSTADTQGILKEGEWTTMHVGVNTPHTLPLTLRVVFTGTRPDSLLFEADAYRPAATRAAVAAGPAGTNIVYVTLPATVNQSTPNTQGSFRVYVLEDSFENGDFQSEAITYTVEAGYLSGGTFTPFGNNATNLFTPIENQTLYVLDNDTPAPPGDIKIWTARDPDRDLPETDRQLPNWSGLRNGTPTSNRADTSIIFIDGSWAGWTDSSGGGSKQDYEPIFGTFDAEKIDGLEGDDDIIGYGGADFLYGGSGDDWIAGHGPIEPGKGVYIDGGIGSDILLGGGGDDYLVGGPDDVTDGRDAINAGYGNDTLKGGGGNDLLFGGANRDTLYGGSGDDVLLGAYTEKNLFISSNRNQWEFTPVADAIASLQSENSFLVYITTLTLKNPEDPVGLVKTRRYTPIDAVGDVLRGEGGQDVLFGANGDDYLDGGDETDIVVGLGGNDLLLGGQGNDYLFAGYGDDQLFGGAGNDVLTGDLYSDPDHAGSEGNDVLDGGAGEDTLSGHGGNDTYLYAIDYGKDTIFDTGGRDVLRFGEGILPRFTILSLEGGSNLVLSPTTLGIPNDKVVINNWLRPSNRVEYVQFNDGSIWDSTAMLRALNIHSNVEATYQSADQLLSDSDVADTTFYLNPGSLVNGFNVVIADGGGNDRLVIDWSEQLNLITPVSNYGVPNDPFSPSPPLTSTTYVIPVLENIFRDGFDLVLELVMRSSSSNIADVNGAVRISNYYTNDGRIEDIQMAGESLYLPSQQVSLSNRDQFDPNSLMMDVGVYANPTGLGGFYQRAPDPDVYTYIVRPYTVYVAGQWVDVGERHIVIRETSIAGYLSNAVINSSVVMGGAGNDVVNARFKYIENILVGRDGDDTLRGGYAHDILGGGAGADRMFGGGGGDIYWIDPNEADVVFDDPTSNLSYGNHDKLHLPDGVTPDQLVFTREGDDLLVGAARIQRYFESHDGIDGFYGNYVYMIEGMVGDGWQIENLPQYLAEIGVFGDYVGTNNGDRIVGDVFGNEINGLGGNDYLVGGTGQDILRGGDGTDLLYQGILPYSLNTFDRNLYDGGNGNDILVAGDDGDAYLISRGGGLDRVIDTGLDQYRSVTEALAHELGRIDTYAGDFFIPTSQFLGALGGDFTYYGMPDALSEAYRSFEGSLYATPGTITKADAAAFMAELQAWLHSDQGDSIVFGDGIAPENLRVNWYGIDVAGSDLVGDPTTYPAGTLHIDLGQGDGVIIHEAEYDPSAGIEFFRFADGRVLTLEEMIALDPDPTFMPMPSNVSSDGDDWFVGGIGQESFDGGAGADVMIGGGTAYVPGDDSGDILQGGDDGDVYHFNVFEPRAVYIGDEDVAFSASGSTDTLSFGQGISPADIRAYLDYVDLGNGAFEATLFLATDAYSEPMTIAWQYVYDDGAGNLTTHDHRLENIQFIGDNRFAAYDLAGLVTARWEELKATTADTPAALFDFPALSDFDITGTTILAGGEAVYNYALTGSIFISPYTHITGTPGNDSLLAGKGGSTIDALAGDDTLTSGMGNDLLIGGAGSDTYIFSAGNGIDTISDSSAPGEINQIVFGPGVSPDSVTLDLGSLLIHYGNQGDRIHIENFDPRNVYGPRTIDRFVFDDGTVWSYEQLLSRGFDITGTPDDDLLTGTNIHDRLSGGAGDDVLLGGTGNDRLIGGAGSDILDGGARDDVYVFNAGDGQDIVDDMSGNDRIEFGAGISRDATALTQDGNDLLLDLGNGDQIRLAEWFTGNAIELFRFENGQEWSFADVTRILSGDTGNTAPVLANPLADQQADEDAIFSYALPADAFSDADTGDSLSYTATLVDGTALPTWLSFDPASRTFTGTPVNGDVGSMDVLVTATDSGGLSVSDTFRLAVQNTNDAPVVANGLAGQTVDEDSPFIASVPIGTFADDDAIHGDTLTYSATLADGTALPSWLTFDAGTRTFTGTPANGDVGALDIRVSATDIQGASVSDVFTLTINNVNDAPVLASAIPDQATTEGQTFSFTLDPAIFADDDAIHGDVLTFSATLAEVATGPSLARDPRLDPIGDGSALPAWLTFDSSTQTFSGTAPDDSTVTGTDGDDVLVSNDVDTVHALRVTATDTGGLSVADDFMLTVHDASPNDVYDGRGGNDVLDTGIGNDTLTGGTGNDVLLGGVGNDTYVYNLGDGLDTLTDTGGADTLRFGPGLTAGQVVVRLEVAPGPSLARDPRLDPIGDTAAGLARLRFLDADGCETTDQGIDITLNVGGSLPIETIRFADGSTLLPADLVIQPLTWYGTHQADILTTGRHDDTIYGGNGQDVLTSGSGNDTLYGENGDDRLYGQGGHDTLTGGRGDDRLDGGCGDDTLVADQGEDTLIGGQGNDTILLGQGEHTILFGSGDGQDTIRSLTSGDDDVEAEVVFGQDLDPNRLWFARRGDNLTVQVLGTTDGLTIEGWYNTNHRPIEEFQTADGSELEGKQIERLVQAMAQFAPSLSAEGTLPPDQQQELNAVIAAAWERG